MIFILEAGRRACREFLAYTVSPVWQLITWMEKTTFRRPALSRMPLIRLDRSKDAGALGEPSGVVEAAALLACVSGRAVDLKFDVRDGEGAEFGPGLIRSTATRTRPGTALAFFILPAIRSTIFIDYIP